MSVADIVDVPVNVVGISGALIAAGPRSSKGRNRRARIVHKQGRGQRIAGMAELMIATAHVDCCRIAATGGTVAPQ